MEYDLLKFALKNNREQYTVEYNSLMLLQKVVSEMNITVAEQDPHDVNHRHFFSSLELASQIPIPEDSLIEECCGEVQERFLEGLLDGDWVNVFTKLMEFLNKCLEDIAKLRGVTVSV